MNVPQMLAGGAADFGIGSNGFIAFNLVQENGRIRAVMAVFQKDPQVLISHPRRDLNKLAEMRGMPILISDAATVTSLWPWLRAQVRISATARSANTRSISRRSWSTPMRSRKAISPASPTRSRQQAHFAPKVSCCPTMAIPATPTWCWCRRNGSTPIQGGAGLLDPRATAGYDYLNGDPRPANALIKRDNPDMSDAIIAQAIAKMKAYGIVMSGDATTLGLGTMTDAKWKTFFDTMTAVGLYPKTLPYKNAYDLRFIRGVPQNFQ